MATIIEPYNLKLAVVKRFFRTFLPQAIVVFPILLKYADEVKEFLPLWVIPILVFAGSVATAGDKLYRELKKE